MNDHDIRKTKQDDAWTINSGGGIREIQIERECYDHTTHYIFLTKADLKRMIKAL